MTFPQTVHITDVGPRDGLQNESTPIAAADKLALIDHLLQAGVQHFEATSFVSPKWVPQMADAAEVMQGLQSPQRQAALVASTTALSSPWAVQRATRWSASTGSCWGARPFVR